jgi:hypothetical protein
VDLSVQTALGKFNPESDTVLVAGEPLNGWSASASPLARSLTQPNLWVGTFEVTNSTGGTLLYK